MASRVVERLRAQELGVIGDLGFVDVDLKNWRTLTTPRLSPRYATTLLRALSY
ncbi:hypothetical protein [Streptomyces sp. NPDC101455]|uniref:hypothetical protein n=1 Tax=Streptomyces sp. NPDC101455 TaxID=3366142 RepID=UPI00380FEAD9